MQTLINDPVFRKETVPASDNERKIISKLKNVFDEHCDWIKTVKIPTDTWFEEECVIETSFKKYDCKTQPYVNSVKIEGEIVTAHLHSNKLYLDRKSNYPIVFVEYPIEPDASKYIVLELYRMGAQAVVFYEKNRDIYRRFVMNGDISYSMRHGSPPPIPVVSIKYSDFREILESNSSRISITIKAHTLHDVEGTILIAGLNGSSDREIHITAHHDHWFTGFSDNLVGLEILYNVVKALRGADTKHNIVFISYTSEEIGAPDYMSWYWIWGSRYYLNMLENTGNLDNVILDINIDTVYKGNLEVYANPSLKPCIEDYSETHSLKYRGNDSMDFDSYSYTLHGVPALTLNTFDELKPIYHSTLDNGSTADLSLIPHTTQVIMDLIKCFTNKKPSYSSLIQYLLDRFGEKAPLEMRILLSKLINLGETISDEEERIRFVTKHFTIASYLPGVNLIYLTDIFSDIILLNKIYDELEKNIDTTILIKSFDQDVAYITLTKYNLMETRYSIKRAISERALYWNKVLEEKLLNKVFQSIESF